MSRERPVLIVGGGIGGLAAALALDQQGIAAHVVEARADPSAAGAGIQIGPNGTRILRSLGVADDLRSLAGAPQAIMVRDAASGAGLARLPLGAWIAERHGAPYWTLHRANLHASLLARARSRPAITLETGHFVEAIGPAGATQRLRLADGTTREGRAIIAADGLWSGVRTSHFGAPTPRPIGVSAARTVAPADQIAPGERAHVGLWLSPALHVVHYPVRGGADIAVIAVFPSFTGVSAAAWDTGLPLDRMSQLSTGVSPLLSAILAAGGPWRTWDLHRAAVVPMASGPVALLGDAAHPIRPHLAQGAVMALEDAVVLARALAEDATDPAAAFARYGARRGPRVAKVAAASQRNGAIFHLGGLATVARNAAMRMLGGEALMRRYDWLYGWRNE